jgi:hypothetical protein
MTKLPATIDEAQALTYARGRIASFRDGKHELYPGMGEYYWLDKADGRRIFVQILKVGALKDSMFMMHVCNAARGGSDLADEALRELIIEFENNPKKSQPLSPTTPWKLPALGLSRNAEAVPKRLITICGISRSALWFLKCI